MYPKHQLCICDGKDLQSFMTLFLFAKLLSPTLILTLSLHNFSPIDLVMSKLNAKCSPHETETNYSQFMNNFVCIINMSIYLYLYNTVMVNS